MGNYPISLVEWNPPSFHEEQSNPQSESQEPNADDKVLNMLRIMSHDIRGSLVSRSATLKLLTRGYYGKMEERVADHLKDLLSKTVGLISITEEFLGQIFSVHDDLEMAGEPLDLKQDIINPVLEELAAEIKARDIQIENDRSETGR
jgi:light-regulated signal transduction histidine kinase (bacteriophytochrome)